MFNVFIHQMLKKQKLPVFLENEIGSVAEKEIEAKVEEDKKEIEEEKNEIEAKVQEEEKESEEAKIEECRLVRFRKDCKSGGGGTSMNLNQVKKWLHNASVKIDLDYLTQLFDAYSVSEAITLDGFGKMIQRMSEEKDN